MLYVGGVSEDRGVVRRLMLTDSEEGVLMEVIDEKEFDSPVYCLEVADTEVYVGL